MDFKESYGIILGELSNLFEKIDEKQVDELIEKINKSEKVFFVGVGRVKLSLEAIAKRLSHLGVSCHVVGEITEPAISENDLLIVGSGSGESLYPLSIAKKAKEIGAMVCYIGSNPNSSMKEYTDIMLRIPTNTKLNLKDELLSKQPMTSLFEQALLILGDSIALKIVNDKNIDMVKLWQYHANLE
ncbi:SIS domain-containing protein [Anaerococcus sp. AGMB00486]|uniref:SIS domain-containing protein n=2 Tax=Anaerococcus TaxID=165779 RepID=A0ABX2N8S2_9FIRM|nr:MULTISPECIES: 6-phospho-3-hexuloisomerase [Anaerococcus]MDY3006579.1 6-phospho-3-hexuloisomerase [Anaerococcus porci]MSS77437.1 SIS domain-containing protein [Anaerococcus porci]NVF11096.1 SIS domain-containing protein [Anaerococcus faecalis]